MELGYQLLLSLGGILLAGQALSALGKKTFLPRVTLLLLFGVLIGDEFLNLIPDFFEDLFEIVAKITLLMVGFLIGGKLSKDFLKSGMGKSIWISLSAAIGTTLIVFLSLFLFGLPVELAILLSCIAAATAPASTLDVVMESNDHGTFSQLLISIVALDDAWSLILFGMGLALAASISGHISDESPFLFATKDIGGAILLGLVLGFIATHLTGRVKPGQPILSEALGLVFICGGLALWLNVSFLIASIVMGAVVASFAKHHEYSFHEIENIEWPFMVIFFVLAGATLNLEMLANIGLFGLAYILSRIIGKLVGARVGSYFSEADRATKNWMGLALLPQAGVAIGMALVASDIFPEHKQTLLSVVISSTIFFEIIGPIFARLAIKKANP
jgi:Kef-type K+ transport system membrane component KefB